VSNFWFRQTERIVANHLSDIPLAEVLPDATERSEVEGRAVVVRKLKALPVEAIVRGYLIGSGWKEYRQTGGVCGIPLPEGLQMAGRLPEAIFTPSTKAAIGEHDENIDFERTRELLGEGLSEQVRSVSLEIYTSCAAYARERGIIIADTKFEFGQDNDGRLMLIDEILTPDSSRFWPADSYVPGSSPVSFDKQFVRDYLETLEWDKNPPGPKLPPDIIERTAAKYREAQARLTD
jgi:phosphoribosylaminoimidazole-succinocarboxamide synthase